MSDFFYGLGIVIIITVFLTTIVSCNRRDTTYNDYEITGTRHYVDSWESGLFTTKTHTSDKMQIFYNDTDITVGVSLIKISSSTFVREYNNRWDMADVYMTQEDFENALEGK